MTRLEANREIVALLQKAIEAYPDLRMGQIISASFYEESTETLEKLQELLFNMGKHEQD